MVNNYSVGTGVVWRNFTFRTASDFCAGRSEFRINSKFHDMLVVTENTVLPLADRWDQGPLSVSSSTSGSLSPSLSRVLSRAFSTGDA